MLPVAKQSCGVDGALSLLQSVRQVVGGEVARLPLLQIALHRAVAQAACFCEQGRKLRVCRLGFTNAVARNFNQYAALKFEARRTKVLGDAKQPVELLLGVFGPADDAEGQDVGFDQQSVGVCLIS